MWLLLGGLLTALGLVVVVFAASALMLVVEPRRDRAPAASPARASRGRAHRREQDDVHAPVCAGTSPEATRSADTRSRARPGAQGTREDDRSTRENHGRGHASQDRRPRDPCVQGYVKAMYRLRLLRLHSIDPGERAQQLNALGAQLRRDGEPEQAAEQHLAALAIVRDLGEDPHAEAMTLNNLGLALAHGGAEDEAVQHLEEARELLRDLGDDEYEARVIANLGLVHRRQGHDEEASTLLHEALDKLPPESQAYRQVEEELVRAS